MLGSFPAPLRAAVISSVFGKGVIPHPSRQLTPLLQGHTLLPCPCLAARTKRAGLNAQLSVFIAGGLRPELSRIHFACVRHLAALNSTRRIHRFMLRSVSHCFAFVKHYLLDRFAFGFRLLAGLHCITNSFYLATLLFSLAFACECRLSLAGLYCSTVYACLTTYRNTIIA